MATTKDTVATIKDTVATTGTGERFDLDRTMAALADPQRRRAIDLLRQRPYRAGELAEELAVAPSVMSKHLRVLRQSGLVSETHPEFDARIRIYSLEAAPMSELRDWLDATERGWTEQLAALRNHLEGPQ
ncbi:MAG: ArsR family transcriptional regulator [Acidimicrobiia bacterium]|nr:ArsR family transcriptional regulator [Acidimicrobiia bacterium]